MSRRGCGSPEERNAQGDRGHEGGACRAAAGPARAAARGAAPSPPPPSGTRHDRLRFVHQDLGLVTELSAVDNLALSRGYARTRLGSIDWAEQERTARALIGRFGMDIDVHRP